MKNTEEIKKEYTAPKMDVVKLKHESNLLQCSEQGGILSCSTEAG